MENKLTKRQLKSLVKKVIAESEISSGKTKTSVSSYNGCIAYRGGRTDPYCENMSLDDCYELDLRLKAENPNYFAVPLKKPCESTS